MTTPTSLTALVQAYQAKPDQTLVWDSTGPTSYRTLNDMFMSFVGTLSPWRGLALGIELPESAVGVACLMACEQLQCQAYLFPFEVSAAERQRIHEVFRLSAMCRWGAGELEIETTGTNESTGEPGVVILTSGTEGPPKAIRHTWQSLLKTVRGRDDRTKPGPWDKPSCWFMGFRLSLYAGLQVLGQGLVEQGTVVIPGSSSTADEVLTLMQASGVTHASATPSYWRRLLVFADEQGMRSLSLRQITLGGEAADQALLDSLIRLYPQARITHIYATTELGRCFAISDGRAGFPEKLLRAGEIPGVELRVAGGELWARSIHAAPATDSAEPSRAGTSELPWIATGDLVTIADGRVQFTGRKSELINVGGNKVHPTVVEQVIRAVPGVRDAIVFGQPSSIAGFLVACQVVPDEGIDWDPLRAQILESCHARLRRHEVPRLIEAVREIALTPAGKRRRAPSPEQQET